MVVVRPITEGGSTPHFKWNVEIVFQAANDQRRLGYRAEGIAKPGTFEIDFVKEPQVHDEKRPEWTTMNLTD